MTTLFIGIILFFGGHLVTKTPLKPALIRRFGANGYRIAYSLVAFLGLGLIVRAYLGSRAGPEALRMAYWLEGPPEWTRHVTMLLVLLGSIALAASFHKGRLKLWLRNPMSVGIALWSAGHLLSNGRLTLVWIFGAFFVYALIDIFTGTPKPFTVKPVHDIIAPVAGLILYAVFLWGFHPYVLNVPIY
jgi:uncharacterized membrane protein